jgi:peptidoglycan/LPS O-acetylase OafA/YrhL
MNHIKQYYVGYAALIAIIVAIVFYVVMSHYTDDMTLYITSPIVWSLIFVPLMLAGQFLVKGQKKDVEHL